MAWSRLVVAVVFGVAVCGFTTVSALAAGTWPASVQLRTSTALRSETVSFVGTGPAEVGAGTCIVTLDTAGPSVA